MTAWTNYVKQYAKDKGITYKNALKDPACASSYKSLEKLENYIAFGNHDMPPASITYSFFRALDEE